MLVNCKLSVLLVFFGMLLPIASIALADDSAELTDKERGFLYRELKDVRMFGAIGVSLVGDAGKVELNESDLTEFVKLRFKDYFGSVKFEDFSKDSQRILELIYTRDKNIGSIAIRVWVVGDDFPVAYHVRFDAGNFNNPSIWSEEILGHGSKKTTPEAVRAIIDEMLKELAVVFFQVKGLEL